MLRPPISTLFPYTTLFRSVQLGVDAGILLQLELQAEGVVHRLFQRRGGSAQPLPARAGCPVQPPVHASLLAQGVFKAVFQQLRSEERRVGKECRERRETAGCKQRMS